MTKLLICILLSTALNIRPYFFESTKIVSENMVLCWELLRVKYKSAVLSLFEVKKLEFFKNLTFLESLHMCYIIEFFLDFLIFFWKFWMIPNDKYTWEGQVLFLSFVLCSLHMKSTINPSFWWILGFLEILGFFQKCLAIYFLTHSYQIWFFWYKIQILQMILDYTDILDNSLGELWIKNAVLVL